MIRILSAVLIGLLFDGLTRAPTPPPPVEVAETVEKAGFDPYEKRLLGITAMTQTLGKKRFNELLGELVMKPQGKPTLVPASDKRPAMNTAKEDFTEVDNNG